MESISSPAGRRTVSSRGKSQPIVNCAVKSCPKRFRTRKAQREHMRVHSNEQPYQCAECNRTFKWRSSLWSHKRAHRSANQDDIRYMTTSPVTVTTESDAPEKETYRGVEEHCVSYREEVEVEVMSKLPLNVTNVPVKPTPTPPTPVHIFDPCYETNLNIDVASQWEYHLPDNVGQLFSIDIFP